MRVKSKIIIIISLFLGILLVAGASGQQTRPRVAGLEHNQEYMTLLLKESKLMAKEDSLSKEVTKVRAVFSQTAENREFVRQEILRLENEIFDVRNETGIIVSRINIIEEDFIFSNLDQPSKSQPENNSFEQPLPSLIDSAGKSFPNLVYNEFFKLNLPPEDYSALLNAQEKEQRVRNFLTIYLTNYTTMREIAERYKAVDNQEKADSLMQRYRSIEQINLIVEDTISMEFNYLFDNKSYAYNYLLDRMDAMNTLEEFERKTNRAIDKKMQMSENMHSLIVASYPVYKELLFDYESMFAKRLSLKKSADSLFKAHSELNHTKFQIPKINMTERLFLDYAQIEVHTPSKYNQSNPIPECEVYERGVIYRILVGGYYRRQPVSAFRGVYPLGYIKGEDNRYRYYAGGFDDHRSAVGAVEMLRKLGFNDPKIAMWNYGAYSEVAMDAQDINSDGEQSEHLFRVEIEGVDNDLSVDVKKAIAELTKEKDILRIGEAFFISAFESRAQAEVVAEIIRTVDRKLTVKISEVPL